MIFVILIGKEGRVKTKIDGYINVRQDPFLHEHMIPASALKNTLIDAYKNNKLTISYIKNLIKDQKMCWILREEDKKLTELKYRSKDRETLKKSYKAYKAAGIIIEQSPVEALPTINKKAIKREENMGTIKPFFIELQKYFDNNPAIGFQNEFKVYENTEYATLYKKMDCGLMLE